MNASGYTYDTNDPLVYRNEMGRYKTARQLTFAQRFVKGGSARILDIGGGAGRLAIPLADRGHCVTVLDPSEVALSLLRERSGGRLATIHNTLERMPTGETFDVALVIDSLKYMTSMSLVEVFRKVHSLLGKNGVVVCAEINQNSWRNHLSCLTGRRRERYNISSASGYTRALNEAGFAILEITGFLWMPFAYNADTPMVNQFASLERVLHLGQWVGQSPWLLMAAQKCPTDLTDSGLSVESGAYYSY